MPRSTPFSLTLQKPEGEDPRKAADALALLHAELAAFYIDSLPWQEEEKQALWDALLLAAEENSGGDSSPRRKSSKSIRDS